MSEYSPFNKPIKDISVNDLVALRDAAEGWYIEYKREMPNASSIAKSISAFSNTYGGWLFYGVCEKSKEDAVAGSFPGILCSEVDAALQRMRQAVAGHLNPSPHFETKVLLGPWEEIGLTQDHAIICVQIRQSYAAPHVHKSGYIYRRVADGSEPRPEGDRFILDQLWKRGADLNKQYEKWINLDPELTENEKDRPYIRLLMVSDLWRDRDLWLDVSLDDMRGIMGGTAEVPASLPFDTIYTSGNGFIARQIKNNDPQSLGLTWRFRQDLVSEVFIPINVYSYSDFSALINDFPGYDHIEYFVEMLKDLGYNSVKFIDMNYIFNVILGVVQTQRRLLEKSGFSEPYYFKNRLLNVWRVTPFLDIGAVLRGFQKHGIPLFLDKSIPVPAGTGPDTFARISVNADVTDEYAISLIHAFQIFSPIAWAFGLPIWLDQGPDGLTNPYHEELWSACQRAMKVQNIRNKSH